MLFVMFCIDKPGMAEKRAETMPAHVEYLNNAPFKNVMSGPLVSDDGKDIVGSLYVIDAEDRSVIEKMQREDPLCQADIWETVEVRAFNKRVDNRD